MSLTSIVRLAFLHRQRVLERHQTQGRQLQEQALRFLVGQGRRTEFGRRHGLDAVRSYDDFARLVPLSTYDDLKGDIDRMRHGQADVLWPGRCRWFAKSSGTTNDKSKFIPVTPRGLQHLHYAGGTDAVVLYLRNHPESRMFDGKGLILGGSHQPNYNLPHSLVGDLSSILIENINPVVNLVRVPKKQTALLSDFEEKRELIARQTIGQNVTNLSGVPSWMLSVLTRVLELKGTDDLSDVWPNLEVFFHGGVAFTPYREQYRRIISSPRMNYMETYNASEGFFGLQDDPADLSMLLMLDYDCFYEFIPTANPLAAPVPLWGVEKGVNYEMVITTSCGLWRYRLGDTVTFTGTNPYKFRISGRTKCFINAFGEELVQDNADQALAAACRETAAEVADYTAAPVFMDGKAKCRHQWVVEFATPPADVDDFARRLDSQLQALNSDYEAKRHKDITLQQLELVVARRGLFGDWLKRHGKLGGQHKVPRLCNDRRHIDEIISMNTTSTSTHAERESSHAERE